MDSCPRSTAGYISIEGAGEAVEGMLTLLTLLTTRHVCEVPGGGEDAILGRMFGDD